MRVLLQVEGHPCTFSARTAAATPSVPENGSHPVVGSGMSRRARLIRVPGPEATYSQLVSFSCSVPNITHVIESDRSRRWERLVVARATCRGTRGLYCTSLVLFFLSSLLSAEMVMMSIRSRSILASSTWVSPRNESSCTLQNHGFSKDSAATR